MSGTPGNAMQRRRRRVRVDDARPPCRARAARRPSPAASRSSRRPAGRATRCTNRCRARIASTICCDAQDRSSSSCVRRRRRAGSLGVELVQHLLDPVLAGDRVVVDERAARARASGAAATRSGGAGTAPRARARGRCSARPSRRRAPCSTRARCCRSALTCTRVSVTNPMPGSCTSRASSIASSPRI